MDEEGELTGWTSSWDQQDTCLLLFAWILSFRRLEFAMAGSGSRCAGG